MLPETWNNWEIIQVCNWFHAVKYCGESRWISGQRWIHRSQIPRLAGFGNEKHLTKWLNEEFPA